MSAPQTSVADTPPLAGLRAYALAGLCLAIALGVRLALDPAWAERFPYVTFFVAVFVVIQLGGIGPFLFTLLGGFLLANWLFVTPRHSLVISGQIHQINTGFYFLISFVMLYFSLRARRALSRERTAREACAQLAAIVESSDDAIIGKSLDGTLVSWNAGAERLYGYTAAEAVGGSIGILALPGRRDETAALLERVGRGERIDHLETVRRTKDGRLVEVSLSISPVRNSTGQVVAVSTIARDITARKQAEREKEALVQQLQTALDEVKTLSGLLPICVHCKSIRDDRGCWNKIELYVREHSSANFTHCICPECARKHYPEVFSE